MYRKQSIAKMICCGILSVVIFLIFSMMDGDYLIISIKPNKALSGAEKSRLKNAYYSSSVVVTAECQGENIAYNNTTRSGFVITEVLAGLVSQGDRITVDCYARAGEIKLLYLKKGVGSINGANNYEIINECAFNINGENVILQDNMEVPLNEIHELIAEQGNELTIPKNFLYYRGFASLVNGCDSIILGTILSISKYEYVTCRSVDRGEISKRDLRVADVVVSVENGLISRYSAGDQISIKIIEEATDFVIDSNDLFPVDKRERQGISPGQYCIVMLKDCEDKKVDYHFEINPYQGFVPITNGKLECGKESAFFSIENVNDFVDKLYKIMNYQYEMEM